MLVELPVLGRKKKIIIIITPVSGLLLCLHPTLLIYHRLKLKHLLHNLKSSRALKRLDKKIIFHHLLCKPLIAVQALVGCASVAVIQLQLLQPSVSVQLIALMI